MLIKNLGCQSRNKSTNLDKIVSMPLVLTFIPTLVKKTGSTQSEVFYSGYFYYWARCLGKIKDLHVESELKTIMIM